MKNEPHDYPLDGPDDIRCTLTDQVARHRVDSLRDLLVRDLNRLEEPLEIHASNGDLFTIVSEGEGFLVAVATGPIADERALEQVASDKLGELLMALADQLPSASGAWVESWSQHALHDQGDTPST